MSTPRIWLVLGDKPGDNAQVEIAAAGLGLPFERRRVIPKSEFVLGKPRVDATLDHLDPAKSDRLEPPWPDLVMTIGRRPSMAALWIRQQSGGRTKLALFGMPKRWRDRFSLIVAPGQYRVAGADNVLPIRFPLMRGNIEAVEAARVAWSARFALLTRPVTALLIGGQTKPYRLDAVYARELGARATELAAAGTLYVSTSRRTPQAAIEALAAVLPASARLFRWAPDAPDNPYHALLALADRFIVTGDSISMMVEVARLGRPLAIAALPYRSAMAGALHRLSSREGGIAGGLRAAGITRGTRDLSQMHRTLYEEGVAQPLEKGFAAPGGVLEDELPRVVGALRALLPL